MAEEVTHKELYARVEVLEKANAVTEERLKQIVQGLADIKQAIEKGFDEIKLGYVTKDELKSVVQDGKYKALWGGVVGAVVMFIVVSMLGMLPNL